MNQIYHDPTDKGAYPPLVLPERSEDLSPDTLGGSSKSLRADVTFAHPFRLISVTYTNFQKPILAKPFI